MKIEKKKKGGKKGGRGCKILVIALVFLLTACGPTKVQIIPSDDQITKVGEVVDQNAKFLNELAVNVDKVVKILQEKGIVPTPKPEEKK